MSFELIDKLVACNCLKFGQFTLKSGSTSPYYIDLRDSWHHPDLRKSLIDALVSKIGDVIGAHPVDKLALVGVPYGAWGLACTASDRISCACYLLRKDKKAYGAEGGLAALKGHRFIVVEDVMSTGSSIVEALEKMDDLNVTDVVVMVDREAGGSQILKTQYPSVNVWTVLKASDILAKCSKITPDYGPV